MVNDNYPFHYETNITYPQNIELLTLGCYFPDFFQFI